MLALSRPDELTCFPPDLLRSSEPAYLGSEILVRAALTYSVMAKLTDEIDYNLMDDKAVEELTRPDNRRKAKGYGDVYNSDTDRQSLRKQGLR